MPWMRTSVELQRQELVSLARQPGANIRQLCRGFGISAKTAYKWMQRESAGQPDWAADRSRRPHHSPGRIPDSLEKRIWEAAQQFPDWGPRKILRVLRDRGHRELPSASTVSAIFQRCGRPPIAGSKQSAAYQRFEHPAPNDLWQMDFKQGFVIGTGHCHPLTIVDDHSRFCPCVQACADQRLESVQPALIQTFRRYGLPHRLLMDNGACWGQPTSRYTRLGAWLIRLGIAITHGRFYHPQTQGKNERFNRTLELEVIRGRHFCDLQACQHSFDAFRYRYNHIRPHEALALHTPVSRYRISAVAYPEILPPIEYPPGDRVRRVRGAGVIFLENVFYQVGRAFAGQPVALRPTEQEGLFEVYYCHHLIAHINQRQHTCTQH